MQKSKQVRTLLYQQELFRARLEIREHFLKNFSREIYENIGQVLSLVKLQLCTSDTGIPAFEQEKNVHLGNLLGQAIKDLRNLSRGFYTDILAAYGLINSLQNEIRLLEKSGKKIVFTITGTITEIPAERELLLFSIIKEILTRVSDTKGARLISVKAMFRQQGLFFTVAYTGNEIKWQTVEKNNSAYRESLTIFQKADFAGARIDIKTARPGKTSIKLAVSNR